MTADRERSQALDRFEQRLGVVFEDRSLLEAALRHSSFAHDVAQAGGAAPPANAPPARSGGKPEAAIESNERLEFLGDAVLGVIVAEALYRAKPSWREGELTRSLHSLVEGRSLAKLATRLGVGPMIEFGRTEQSSGGAEKPSILADAVEALIGAMYLDGGLDKARAFVEAAFGKALTSEAPRVARDPKTELQERAMAAQGEFPEYRLTHDTQIEGDDERFSVEVLLRGVPLAEGIGRTKRKAERQAARTALERNRLETLEATEHGADSHQADDRADDPADDRAGEQAGDAAQASPGAEA